MSFSAWKPSGSSVIRNHTTYTRILIKSATLKCTICETLLAKSGVYGDAFVPEILDDHFDRVGLGPDDPLDDENYLALTDAQCDGFIVCMECIKASKAEVFTYDNKGKWNQQPLMKLWKE